jgi:hypothetical protein
MLAIIQLRNFLSSNLLSKNLKIKIHRNITLLVVWYGCETWSLIFRKERRLWVFEKSVTGQKIFKIGGRAKNVARQMIRGR